MVVNSSEESRKNTDNLYKEDYYLWLESTVKILRNGQLSQLDVPNLIEEIEDMGRSEKRAVKNNLIVVLMHLIKYKYQPEKRTNSWRFTIKEHRRRLNEDLDNSPSLRRYLLECFAQSYTDARDLAATETGLSLDIFPLISPFTPEETLSSDYLPE